MNDGLTSSVTAIVVSWNGKKWLRKCLDSLLKQDHQRLEIILIDNHSSDGSVSYVRKRFPRVKVLQTRNQGYGHACNVGVAQATGDFLLFFNEDMYVAKDFTSQLLRAYHRLSPQEKARFGTLGCPLNHYDGTPTYSKPQWGQGIDVMGAPLINFRRSKLFFNSGCPLLIRRDTFLKVGGFCDNFFLYSEDLDLCWRMNIFGYQHFFTNSTALYHYGGGVIGQFSPAKMRHYVHGELNCVMNNYSVVVLVPALLYMLIFYCFAAIGFLVTGRRQYWAVGLVTIASEFRHNLNKMLRFRRKVQQQRVTSDWRLLGRISLLPSRMRNAIRNKHFVMTKGVTHEK